VSQPAATVFFRPSPPKTWPKSRVREYFDWAKRVVDGLRGVHPGLEALFDEVYLGKP